MADEFVLRTWASVGEKTPDRWLDVLATQQPTVERRVTLVGVAEALKRTPDDALVYIGVVDGASVRDLTEDERSELEHRTGRVIR